MVNARDFDRPMNKYYLPNECIYLVLWTQRRDRCGNYENHQFAY